ncbi:MAG: DNA alkylation repair protein [Muribaculaceae bacterium]|nr:DNA alkylation repair protein [Muribaculaceae bacterium]
MDISQHEEGLSEMQEVKRRFFALRNGIVADTLRSNGSPFRIIFGLNLPQLKEIAAFTGENRELAEALWNNTTTRESMMLAPMIFPREEFDEAHAQKWLDASPSSEITDALCHSMLRHRPYAQALALQRLKCAKNEHDAYGALRLALNVVSRIDAEALRGAVDGLPSEIKACPTILRLMRQLEEELEFLAESR